MSDPYFHKGGARAPALGVMLFPATVVLFPAIWFVLLLSTDFNFSTLFNSSRAFADSPPAAVTGEEPPLSRVTYRLGTRELTAICEVDYSSAEEAKLRLFDTSIAEYYTLYVPPEDLITVERLPSSDSSELRSGWESLRRDAHARREEIEKVRLERKRLLEEEARKQAAARSRGERDPKDPGPKEPGAGKPEGGKREGKSDKGPRDLDDPDLTPEMRAKLIAKERARRRESAGKEIELLAGELDKLGGRVAGIDANHAEKLAIVRDRATGKLAPKESRALRDEMECSARMIAEIGKKLQTRRGEFKQLLAASTDASVGVAQLEGDLASLKRRVSTIQEALTKVELAFEKVPERIDGLPPAVVEEPLQHTNGISASGSSSAAEAGRTGAKKRSARSSSMRDDRANEPGGSWKRPASVDAPTNSTPPEAVPFGGARGSEPNGTPSSSEMAVTTVSSATVAEPLNPAGPSDSAAADPVGPPESGSSRGWIAGVALVAACFGAAIYAFRSHRARVAAELA